VQKALGAVSTPLPAADQQKLSIAVLRYVAREQEFLRRKVDQVPVPANRQEFPRMIHYWDGRNEKVEDLESYLSWPAGWGSSREFEKFLPLARKLDEDAMLRCADEWDLEGLNPDIRSRLQGVLLQGLSKVDGVYEKEELRVMHDATCTVMNGVFDGLASVLFEEKVLTEPIVTNALPDLVWLVAIAGGWWHTADLVDHYIFNAKIGPYYYFRHAEQDWTRLFRQPQLEWRAKLRVRGSTQHGDRSDVVRSGAIKIHVRAARSASKKVGPYTEIDKALRQIALAVPTSQEEVFKQLDSRKVKVPPAEPFHTAKGWGAGFKRDPSSARSWLSKRWKTLGLATLPRGPK
jgi:hypothetical protein